MDIIMDTLDLGSREFLYCRDAKFTKNLSEVKCFITTGIFNLSILKNYRRGVAVFNYPTHTFIIKEKYLDKYTLKEPPRTAHIVYL